MVSQIKVDSILESSSGNGVTIDGALIKDGKVTGGATGLTLLHSSTFSTVSSKSIDSVFSSTYTNYKINLSILSSATSDYYLRFRDGSGDVTTGAYDWKYMYAISNATWVAHDNGSNANKAEYISGGGGNSDHYNGIFEIFNPNVTENTTFQYQGNRESGQFLIASGGFDGSTQFTGITFFNASGTISGEIQIYGYGK